MPTLLDLDVKVFDRLREIVYEHSGITIAAGKRAMVASRLARRLRSLKIEDDREYLEYLLANLEQEIVPLLDAISTNVTHFFREKDHFEFTSQTVEAWARAGQSRFRVWCAASSTGEEPYSLGMTILDAIRRAGRRPDYRLLATDISTSVLERAERGVYSAEKIEKIDPDLRARYVKAVDGGNYQVNQELRKASVFRRLNLSKPPFPMNGPLDLVFCRNVMIYFDDAVRGRLIPEFHRLLRPDGYLIVGHSESLTQASDMFRRVGASIYAKV